MIGYTNRKTMPWRNGHNRIRESVCSGRLSVTRRLHAAMPAAKRQPRFETCTVPGGADLSSDI
jgi:chorismate mutase